MNSEIFVFMEQRDGKLQNVGYELLGEATFLAKDINSKVIAVVLGKDMRKSCEKLGEYGADEVVLIEDDMLKEYVTAPYTKAMCELVKRRDPEIVLFGATTIGRDFAPRVSARLKTGLTADCTGLAINPDSKLLMMTRPAFGGNLMAVIQCKNHRPQMATVRTGVMQVCERIEGKMCAFSTFDAKLEVEDMNVELIEVIHHKKKSKDITKAKVIISGGRGVGANFTAINDVAQALDGEVAGSRAAIDAGWLDKNLQVGQTGKTVRPELYMARGISGAIQHVAGMENSGTIVAINKNEAAPIFGVCDLGIVGDLHAILPKLTVAINEAKQAGADYVVPETAGLMGLENLLFNIKNGVAYVTINRPRQLNALNQKTIKELSFVVDKIRDDESVKVVIVRGAGGRAFVAGADISEMQDLNEEQGAEMSRLAQETFTKLKELPQIVIGAINGYTLGGGNELAMACDIRIASNRSKFGQPEVNLGLIPGFTGTQRLSRLVGDSEAKKIIFSTDHISAHEALSIGLVNAVVPPEGLMRAAEDLAAKMMSKSMKAIMASKKAINDGLPLEFKQGLIVENEHWKACFAVDGDGKEGMTAFVEKRKANFDK